MVQHTHGRDAHWELMRHNERDDDASGEEARGETRSHGDPVQDGVKTESEDRGQPERALVGVPLLIAGRVVTLSVGSGVRVREDLKPQMLILLL